MTSLSKDYPEIAAARDCTPMRVGPGDARYIFVPGIVKPINCGSARVALLIVDAVNAHDELFAIVQRVAQHFEGSDSPLGIDAAAALAKVAS